MEYFFKNKKNILWIIVIFGLLIVLMIILLSGLTKQKGYIEYVEIDAPRIVYLENDYELKVKAIGSGNLSDAIHRVRVSDEEVVNVYNLKLYGSNAETKIIPKKVGKASITVHGELGPQKSDPRSIEVLVCKALTPDVIIGKTFYVNDIFELPLDIGPKECVDNVGVSSMNSRYFEEIDGKYKIIRTGSIKITVKDEINTLTIDLTIEEK